MEISTLLFTLKPGLKKVVLPDNFNEPISKGFFYEGIEEIVFGGNYDKKFDKGALPNSLTRFTLGNCYDQKFDQGALPNSLTHFTLGNYYDQKFDQEVLPNSLTHFTLGFNYVQKFNKGVLPNSLTHFTLGKCYYQKFDKGVLPNSLIYFAICNEYNIVSLNISGKNEQSNNSPLPSNLSQILIYDYCKFVIDDEIRKNNEVIDCGKIDPDFGNFEKKIYVFIIKLPITNVKELNNTNDTQVDENQQIKLEKIRERIMELNNSINQLQIEKDSLLFELYVDVIKNK